MSATPDAVLKLKRKGFFAKFTHTGVRCVMKVLSCAACFVRVFFLLAEAFATSARMFVLSAACE